MIRGVAAVIDRARTCTQVWFSRTIVALLPLIMVSGCSGNLLAGAPMGAALASCSTQADATRMIPEISGVSYHAPLYPVHAVRVVGPIKSSVPPPILAATFKTALESTMSNANFLQSDATANHYILVANIESQKRQGTFAQTSLELTVKYTLLRQEASELPVWETEITTTGEMQDWKTDACKRLRKLQENLSKQNIRQLLDKLPAK